MFVVPIFDNNSPPPVLLSRNLVFSAEEAQDFINTFDTSSGLICGSYSMYYFLLNKSTVGALIQAFPFPLNPDGTIIYTDGAPYQQVTQNKEVAQGFGTQSKSWGSDPNDPQSVKAQEIAKEIITGASESDLSGAGDLITNFFALCDAIIAELKANRKLDKLFRASQINLVQQVRDQVSSGILSITDALQELINDGLLA